MLTNLKIPGTVLFAHRFYESQNTPFRTANNNNFKGNNLHKKHYTNNSHKNNYTNNFL